MTSPTYHFPLAPSSAARWVACPASVDLCARYPGEDTPQSLEGTAAHWVASEMLEGVVIPAGTLAPNGVEVTEEMLDAADLYVDDVREVAAGGGDLHIEETVLIKSIHSDNGGTPDAWHWLAATRVITIWDFKYGHGFVDAYENWQLIDYVAGILEKLGINGSNDAQATVRMRVVQPRNYHRDGPIREWSVKAVDLRSYFNILRMAATKAWLRKDAKCIPNTECKHCSARHVCTALQQTGFEGMDVVSGMAPSELSPEALSLELRMLQHYKARMEARMTGLEAMAAAEIKAGRSVLGFGMEPTQGRVKWTKPIEEVVALGQMMGVDISKPGALTPAQAAKKGLPAELLAAYSARDEGGLKLAAVDGSAARRVFGS